MTHSIKTDVFPTRTLTCLTSSDVLPREETLKNILDKEQLYPFITRLDNRKVYWTPRPLDNASRKNFTDTVARLGEGSCHRPTFDAIHKKLIQRCIPKSGSHRVDSRTCYKFKTHFFVVKPCFTFGVRNVQSGTCHILQVGSVPLLLFVYLRNHSMIKKPILREKFFDCTEQFKFTAKKLEPHQNYRLSSKCSYILCSEIRSYFGIHVVTADARLPFPTVNLFPRQTPKTCSSTVSYPDTLYSRPIQTPLIEDVSLGGNSSSEDEASPFLQPATLPPHDLMPPPAVPIRKTHVPASSCVAAATAVSSRVAAAGASSRVAAAGASSRVAAAGASSRVETAKPLSPRLEAAKPLSPRLEAAKPLSPRVEAATPAIPLQPPLSEKMPRGVFHFPTWYQTLRDQQYGPIEKVSPQPMANQQESLDVIEVALDLSLPKEQTSQAMDLSLTQPPVSHPTEEQSVQEQGAFMEPLTPLLTHTPTESLQAMSVFSPRAIIDHMVQQLQGEDAQDSMLQFFQQPPSQQQTTPHLAQESLQPPSQQQMTPLLAQESLQPSSQQQTTPLPFHDSLQQMTPLSFPENLQSPPQQMTPLSFPENQQSPQLVFQESNLQSVSSYSHETYFFREF